MAIDLRMLCAKLVQQIAQAKPELPEASIRSIQVSGLLIQDRLVTEQLVASAKKNMQLQVLKKCCILHLFSCCAEFLPPSIATSVLQHHYFWMSRS